MASPGAGEEMESLRQRSVSSRVTRVPRTSKEPSKQGMITGYSNITDRSRTSSAKLRADRRKSTTSSIDDDLSGDDTDLEDGPIDSVHKTPSHKTAIELYCAACRHNRLTPIKEFIEQLGGSKIELKHKSLKPKDLAPIVISLLNDVNVKHLLLPGNNIGERGIHFISDMMSENMDIRTLDISDNKLGQPGAIAIGEILLVNNNLRRLTASGNDFYEKDAYHIVSAMQSNFSLKELDLSHNEFREEGGILIGHMLEKNEGLEVLSLSWNHLRMKGATEICRGLAFNLTLVHLNLSWNGLTNEGARAMGDALKINNSLEYLDLTNNRISIVGAFGLAQGLAVNQSLQVLRLSQNPISTIGALQLLCSIRDNLQTGMIELDVEDVPVTYDFEVVLNEVIDRKSDFKVRHGEFVNAPDVVGASILSMDSMKIDPFKLLMVYTQKENLRLWDVFSQFDKDGSMSISKDEFKHAIKLANIQMTEKNLDLLIKQLDKDGDGEVDFGELVDAQKEYILRERKKKIRAKAVDDEQKGAIKSRVLKKSKGLLRPKHMSSSAFNASSTGPSPNRPASARLNSPELLKASCPIKKVDSANSDQPDTLPPPRLQGTEQDHRQPEDGDQKERDGQQGNGEQKDNSEE